MGNNSFSNRLKKALEINNMRPIDLSNKTGIDKSSISSYISGRYKAKDDNLHSIAVALNVSEAWLLGFNVSVDGTEEINNDEQPNKLDILYDRAKKILSEDDKATIEFILKKAIDNYEKSNN